MDPIRTNLLVGNATALAAAGSTSADAVTADAALLPRPPARRGTSAPPLTVARPLHMRIAIDRRLGFEASLEETINPAVVAVLLGGSDRPQDVRDADVALRRREMRTGLEPGAVRLVCEVGSALALRALPQMIEAVDRHSAVALNTDALAADLALPGPPATHIALIEHAMAEVAITARAARLPWLLLAPALDVGVRSMLATRAHAHGASGVYVVHEPEAAGFNSLFSK
ncbi:MAG: aldolase/citrate lyase family protein [Dehalococcoidia bacterium]